MRQVVEIATQMLRARTTWLKAREDRLSANADASGTSSGSSERPPRVAAERYTEGVMEALAWVLHVDLGVMRAPKLAGVAEPPEHVLVTAVPAYNGYLVEMPSNPEPGWQTEYFSFFVSERQLIELGRAMVNLLPGTGSRSGSIAGSATRDADAPQAESVSEGEDREDPQRDREREPILLLRQREGPVRIIRQQPAADADAGASPLGTGASPLGTGASPLGTGASTVSGAEKWNDGTTDGGASNAGA